MTHIRVRDRAGQSLDPNDDTLRPLASYSSRLLSSRPGKHLHRSTIFRLALRGDSTGRKIKSVRIGGGRFSCDRWVSAYIHGSSTDDKDQVETRELTPDENEILARHRIPNGQPRRSGGDR